MKRLLLILSVVFCSFLPLNVASAAFNPLAPCSSASIKDGTCTNPCPAGSNQSICTDANKQAKSDTNPVVTTIAKAVKVIGLLIGMVAVILFVSSGLSLILSGGNAESVKNAKSRIVAAVVGLVVGALAYTIASFVISRLLV